MTTETTLFLVTMTQRYTDKTASCVIRAVSSVSAIGIAAENFAGTKDCAKIEAKPLVVYN